MAGGSKKKRGYQEINRLSAQTRQKAWRLFIELQQSGLSPEIALKKALNDACPLPDDPYYRWYYPNKRRELRLWEKHGLWPLSKPKDIEYDTKPKNRDGIAGTWGKETGLSEPFDAVLFSPADVMKLVAEYEATGKYPWLDDDEDDDEEGPTIVWDPLTDRK